MLFHPLANNVCHHMVPLLLCECSGFVSRGGESEEKRCWLYESSAETEPICSDRSSSFFWLRTSVYLSVSSHPLFLRLRFYPHLMERGWASENEGKINILCLSYISINFRLSKPYPRKLIFFSCINWLFFI